jgi:tRNA(Ile)-lysidine synthase
VLKQLESNIVKNKLFTKKHRLLLALSGGVDSVVLAHLLKEGGFHFALAHSNFKLRGKDSDSDEKFCRDLAKKLEVNIFVYHPNVQEYCHKHGVSVQMAARELRYSWFNELITKEKYNVVVTAHHANDMMETMLINLIRGTGIRGMKGIPVKNGNVVRPMLLFTRQQIEEYAKKHKLKFRTDKSNYENKYERNFLRNKVIPLLKEINPSLENTLLGNAARFAREASVVDQYLGQRTGKLIEKKKNGEFLSRKQFRKEKHPEEILHDWLSKFHFSETQQENILECINSSSNEKKQFHSSTHQLIISRDEIALLPLKKETTEIKIDSLKDLKKTSLFSMSEETSFKIPLKNELLVEKQKLVFPLSVRSLKTGDKFKPFGMKGFKLVSDFLKDEKLTVIEKQEVKLLVNGNDEIVWIVAYRSDERYRINDKKGEFIKLKLIE